MKITFEEKEYIKMALQKWDEIVMGERDIGDVTRHCILCEQYMEYNENGIVCDRCPLSRYGNGCLETHSTWYTIHNIIEMHQEINFDNTYFNWKFAEKNIDLFHELFILCNRIRKSLEGILDCAVVDAI